MSNQVVGTVLALLIPISFFVGRYWNQEPSYQDRIADMVLCHGYSEEFLAHFGYTGENKREECAELNKALMNQAIDKCSDQITEFGSVTAIGESRFGDLVDQCVYHTLSNQIGLSQAVALIEYRSNE